MRILLPFLSFSFCIVVIFYVVHSTGSLEMKCVQTNQNIYFQVFFFLFFFCCFIFQMLDMSSSDTQNIISIQ